jgi:hypothetical protein
MNIFFSEINQLQCQDLALHLHIQFAPSRGIYFSFIGYWLHYIYGNFKMHVRVRHCQFSSFFTAFQSIKLVLNI